MTDTNPNDTEQTRQTSISRRQALAGIGAAGVFGVLGPGSLASAADDSLTERQAQWTARRRERAAATVADRTIAGISSAVDRLQPDVETNRWDLQDLTDSIVEETVRNSLGDADLPLDTLDTTSQLQYVGVQWDEYSNPTPETGDDGAWKHTFVLSTVGAAQRLDPEATWESAVDDVDYTADHLQYRPHPAIKVQPGLRVMATADAEYDAIENPWDEQSHTVDEDVPDQTDGDDEGQKHVAISARRDRNLFGFGGPQALAEQVDGETVMRDLMNQIATAHTESIANYAALRRSMYEAAERRSNVKAMGRILGGLIGIAGAAGANDRVAGPLESAATDVTEDGEIDPGEVLEAAVLPEFSNDYLEDAATIAGDIQELLDQPEYDKTAREFYHGFDQFLDGAGPYSLGYVLFDVYVAPGMTGRVDVSVANRFTDNESPEITDALDDYPVAAQTWRLEFEGLPPEPEAGDPSNEELYNAEIVDYDFSVSETSGNQEYTYVSHMEDQERPTMPGPTILPRVDGDPGVADHVTAGDRPTFSAFDSTLCTGPITGHEWSIHQLREADDGSGDMIAQPAYDEQVDEGPTFSPEIEAPGTQDAGTQRVELTVSSNEGESASTHFDFSVGQPEAPEPTIEVSPAEPTVVDTLTFEADADMPGEQVDYTWNVAGHPPELDNVPNYVLEGSGEQYTFDPPVAGSYTLSLWVTDDLGAEAGTSATVTVEDGFSVAVDAPDAVAPGQSYSFEASVTSDVSVEAYDWVIFGESATGQTVSATYERGDEPTVSLTVTAADGTTTSHAIDLTVLDMAVELDGPSTLEVGETGTVEATVSGAEADVNYAFDNADAVDSSQRTSNTRPVTFESIGAETVSVTATEVGDDNEQASDSIEIDVVSFPLSIDGPAEPKEGVSVTYEASVGDGVGDASYEWEAFGESHTGSSVTGTFEEPGEHVVRLTATADGNAATTSLAVTVQSDDDMTVELDGPSTLEVGESGTVEATVSGAEADVEYAFDNTDPVNGYQPDSPTRRVEFESAGTETVSVTAAEDGDNGELASASHDVEVVETVGPIDGYTPTDTNGDGLYRDVNGDESVSNGDVVTFFSNQHVDPWDSRPDLFDFTGDDDVSQADVIALFEFVN